MNEETHSVGTIIIGIVIPLIPTIINIVDEMEELWTIPSTLAEAEEFKYKYF